MRTMLAVCATLTIASPLAAQPLPLVLIEAPATAQTADPIVRAAELIRSHRPADAITLLDPLIEAGDRQHADERRRIYCARTPQEIVIYMGEAASDRKEAVALDTSWSDTIFLKGFALIDLGRSIEAGPFLHRAVELAPRNAHYLAELAEWYKSRREWEQAIALFRRAAESTQFSPPDRHDVEIARAWRGVGFVLIEQGRWDEAEAMFRRCLELNPNDSGARTELDYLEEQRAGRGRAGT